MTVPCVGTWTVNGPRLEYRAAQRMQLGLRDKNLSPGKDPLAVLLEQYIWRTTGRTTPYVLEWSNGEIQLLRSTQT